MSFSSTVKDELVGIKTQSREERLSILCGLTHTAAAVTLGPVSYTHLDVYKRQDLR